MSDRVFISSTCYDLIDLRAELENELKDLGLKPIMSDSLSAEFNVAQDKNSIESCLVNVKNCDVFIIILSQRYGPSLEKAGYGNVSTTHLEYLEAKKLKKPLYMYVRDRLEADFNIRKNNKGKEVELAWVKSGDEGIFSLLEEHRSLISKAEYSNWFWTFRNSFELRERIRSDLRKQSGKAILKTLMEKENIPLLMPHVTTLSTSNFSSNRLLSKISINITNVGSSVAIQPRIALFSKEDEVNSSQVIDIKTLQPKDHDGFKITTFKVRKKNLKPIDNPTCESRYTVLWLNCDYKTIGGHYIGDQFSFNCLLDSGGAPRKLMVNYLNKCYYNSSAIPLRTP